MNVKVLLVVWLLCTGLNSLSAQIFDKVMDGLDKTGKEANAIEQISRSADQSRRKRPVRGLRVVSPHPDMDVQVVRCRAAASTVLVDMVITYYGDDQKFTLGGAGGNSKNTTLAYDDCGNQYDCYSIGVRIANGNQEHYHGTTALFPMEVPMKVQLEIKDVPETARRIQRLYLKVKSGNDPIMVYNLPIARRMDAVQTLEDPISAEDNALTDNVMPDLKADSSEKSVPVENVAEEIVEEDFATFESRFMSDPDFQISRIIFDNLGFKSVEPEVEPEKLTPENWVIQRMTLAQIAKTGKYKTKQDLTKDTCVNQIWVENSGFLQQYTFSRIKGKWYLTEYFERV